MNKISDIVEGFFSTLNIRDDNGYVPFLAAWEDLVGTDFACHARPEEIRKGMLVIVCDHPGWIQKMRLYEHSLLQKIQKRFPGLEIQRLAWRHGVLEKPQRRVNPERAEIRPIKNNADEETIKPTEQVDYKATTKNTSQKKMELPSELEGHVELFRQILREREGQDKDR